MIGFPLCFFIEFRRVFIDWVPSFPPCFLIELRRFFHQLNTQFFPQFLTGLRRFFLIKAMISIPYTFVGACVQEGKQFNIMKSHHQLQDKSKLIETILYHNLSQSWSFIHHPSLDLLKLLSQSLKSTFESTYIIKLFNQSILNWRRYWLVVCCVLRRT